MKTIYIIIITVVCTLVGLYVAGMTALTIMFGEIIESSTISDEMSQECEEKYYDETKEWREQKEYNDCMDRMREFLDV